MYFGSTNNSVKHSPFGTPQFWPDPPEYFKSSETFLTSEMWSSTPGRKSKFCTPCWTPRGTFSQRGGKLMGPCQRACSLFGKGRHRSTYPTSPNLHSTCRTRNRAQLVTICHRPAVPRTSLGSHQDSLGFHKPTGAHKALQKKANAVQAARTSGVY